MRYGSRTTRLLTRAAEKRYFERSNDWRNSWFGLKWERISIGIGSGPAGRKAIALAEDVGYAVQVIDNRNFRGGDRSMLVGRFVREKILAILRVRAGDSRCAGNQVINQLRVFNDYTYKA